MEWCLMKEFIRLSAAAAALSFDSSKLKPQSKPIEASAFSSLSVLSAIVKAGLAKGRENESL